MSSHEYPFVDFQERDVPILIDEHDPSKGTALRTNGRLRDEKFKVRHSYPVCLDRYVERDANGTVVRLAYIGINFGALFIDTDHDGEYLRQTDAEQMGDMLTNPDGTERDLERAAVALLGLYRRATAHDQ
jgi:hypothetical protein